MFWIALSAATATQLSAPHPKHFWFESSDTPVQDMPQQGFAIVRLRLTISPVGVLRKCEIEQSSGVARLDSYTCDLTRLRARFLSARLADGTPSYGVFRVPVVWALAPVDLNVDGDLVITVTALPEGIHSPASVRLAIAVDRSGHISSCADEAPAFAGAHPADSQLVSIACSQLTKNYAPPPATDEQGHAVSSVQTASVVFTTDK